VGRNAAQLAPRLGVPRHHAAPADERASLDPDVVDDDAPDPEQRIRFDRRMPATALPAESRARAPITTQWLSWTRLPILT
jgi:hypothetical protein